MSAADKLVRLSRSLRFEPHVTVSGYVLRMTTRSSSPVFFEMDLNGLVARGGNVFPI